MKEIVEQFRRYILHVGVLSFCIDVLLLTQPIFMLNVLDKVVASRSNETLFALLAIALYAVAVMGVLETLRSRLLHRFAVTFKSRISPQLMQLNLRRLQQHELGRHALDDVADLESFISGSGIKAVFAIPWIPLMLFILYLFHPALAIATGIIAAILAILAVLENRLTAAPQKRTQELQRQAATFANTARQSVEAVASLGMHDAVTERWARMNGESVAQSGRVARVSSVTQGIARFVRVGGQLVVLSVGAWLLLNVQGVTAGIMIAALILTSKTLAPIEQLIGSWKSIINARSAYARLTRLVADTRAAELEDLQLPRPLGQVSVENVFLQFGPSARVLSRINFKLPAGGSLGIIGPSGSGKTSLARLLVGLLKPSQGHVRLDGAEVFQWAQGDLGRYLGYLPQAVVLFPGTIAENIARMQDADANNAAIIAAAKKARAHNMILAMPDGYATQVGEGGSRLSGGQRQMIGLARALYGNPSLVLLDEPNSNLDSTAEFALADVIRNLKISRVTVIIIAHRPSVIRDMDFLLFLRGGDQVIFGPAPEVMRQLSTGGLLQGPEGQGGNAPQIPPALPAEPAGDGGRKKEETE